jgi:hypothetical protein
VRGRGFEIRAYKVRAQNRSRESEKGKGHKYVVSDLESRKRYQDLIIHSHGPFSVRSLTIVMLLYYAETKSRWGLFLVPPSAESVLARSPSLLWNLCDEKCK